MGRWSTEATFISDISFQIIPGFYAAKPYSKDPVLSIINEHPGLRLSTCILHLRLILQIHDLLMSKWSFALFAFSEVSSQTPDSAGVNPV